MTGRTAADGRKALRGFPRRSRRYGVGKEIGVAIYVHRAYEHVLGEAARDARAALPEACAYDVVKLNHRTGTVSFIRCPDFDTAEEPEVQEVWTVGPTGTVRFRPPLSDPFIYHHKWLFVDEEYPGFDVARSRERSRRWWTLPGVDRSRIGRRSYWDSAVLPHLIG